MRNNDLKDNSIKYDFSNKESQRLLKEFTILLAEITKYIDKKEGILLSVNLENENLKNELKTVKNEIDVSKEELKKVKDEYLILSNKLVEVTGGRYMLKALIKKIKNKLIRIFK
jgi:aspartate ammonia-lyase